MIAGRPLRARRAGEQRLDRYAVPTGRSGNRKPEAGSREPGAGNYPEAGTDIRLERARRTGDQGWLATIRKILRKHVYS